jgi:hypothetical protein
MYSLIALLKDFNLELPEEVINKLPEELTIELVNGKKDFNRFVKELRSDSKIIEIAKQYPDLFFIQEMSRNVISFHIGVKEDNSECIEALILKPRFKF